MGKYRNDGVFYIKTMNEVRVQKDGMPYTVFAKIIPPGVIVEHMWMSIWQLSEDKIASGNLHHKQQFVNTIGMANIDIASGADDWSGVGSTDGTGTGLEDSQDHLNGWVATKLPLSSLGMIDEDDQQDYHVGMVGNKYDFSRWYKDRQIDKDEGWMGFGSNAIMVESDTMRYQHFYSTGRDGKNVTGHQCSVDSFKLIALQCATDAIVADGHTQDPEMHLAGDNSGNLDNLSTQAFYLFGDQGVSYADTLSSYDGASSIGGQHSGAYENAESARDLKTDQLEYWATKGWIENTSGSGITGSVDSDLITQAKVTLKCKILKPRQSRVWTPG